MKFLILISIFFINHSHAQFQLESVIYQQDSISAKDEDYVGNETKLILGDEEITEQKATSIDDILQGTVAATTARGPRSSAQSIQVRGLDANKILIMVDGVRQNYREGHSAMNPVDLENLKAVEIDTNSADFSKGGSLGGGAHFITKDASDYLSRDEEYGQEFKLQSSSADSEKRVNAKTLFKKTNLEGLLSITSAEANDLQLNDGNTLQNSSYQDFSTLMKFKFKNFGFNYEYFRRKDNNPLDPSLNPPNQFEDLLADSRLTKNSFSVTYTNSKAHSKTQSQNDVKLYLNDYVTDKNNRESKVSELRSIRTLGISYVGKTNNLRYGLELYRDSLDSEIAGNVIESYPKASSINNHVFVENKFTFKNYKIIPGIRLSRYELNNNENNKNAHVISKKLYQELELFKNSVVFASYSEGMNAPKVTEVYPSGLHSPGDDFIVRDNYFIPNLDLEHETSSNKELGVKFEKSFSYLDKLNFKASVFKNDIKNYIRIERIDRSILDDENGTSQFVNIPDVELSGVEAQLNYMYDIYNASIGYSSIRGRNKTDNLYLEDLPADQYLYSFNVYLDNMNFGYSGVQAYAQNRVNPQTLQRTEKTPGYFIHNIFFNINVIKDLELGARVNNLGNQEYRRHASHLNEAAEDMRLSLLYKINTL